MDTKEIILAIRNKQNQWEAYTVEKQQFNFIGKYITFDILRMQAPYKILEVEKAKFVKPNDTAELKGFGNFSIYKSSEYTDELLNHHIFIAKLMDSENNYKFIGLNEEVNSIYEFCKMEDGILKLDSYFKSQFVKINYLLFINENTQEFEPTYPVYY